MAADIVPVRLGLTKGDLYTLWAPRWRAGGDEWEAFLGKDEDLYGFESVADLVAFVRTNTDHDLADHPAWEKFSAANAHRFVPTDEHCYDLIGLPELVAEKPTEESVARLHRTLAVVASLAAVCELPAVNKFFNGNPTLGIVGGGMEVFAKRAGRKRWVEIGAIIARGWDGVIDALDELVAVPDVDRKAAEQAAAELEQPAPEPEEAEEVVIEGEVDTDEEAAALAAEATSQVLGSDADFWTKVGIDPVQILTTNGTWFTLRCYLGDDPLFLGRNGRISVFGSERALARYLADEHDHDLADLPTYDDIRTAATDGSLQVRVTEDNVYVLTGIAEDIADGPDAVDREQLDLAVELLHDVGVYSEEKIVAETLTTATPLGRFIGHVLEPDKVQRPEPPYAEAVEQWEQLVAFVESRLRPE